MLDRGEHMWWLRRIAVFTFSALMNAGIPQVFKQVQSSNLPSHIKVIKNDFYALRVIKVYLYEPNID